MGRRTLLLVAALLLAAIGTGVLFLYMQASRSAISSTSSTDQTELVMVPQADIPEGTPVKTAGFVTVPMLRSVVAQAGYLTEQTLKPFTNKVTTRRLTAGVPVVAGDFGDLVKGTSTIPLTPGTMNIAVELDDPARVGNFLVPGARVAVWVLDADTKRTAHEARIVLPDVTVVTTGSTGTIRTSGETAPAAGNDGSGLVVLQVDQAQAGKLLVAMKAGDLYFTLLGDKTTPRPDTYTE